MSLMRTALFLLLLFTASACADENYLRLEISPLALAYYPTGNRPQSFVSNEGDTLIFTVVESGRSFQSTSVKNSDSGPLPALEELRLESRTMHLRCDSPLVLSFRFHLESRYRPELPRQSSDFLSLEMQDEPNQVLTSIELEYQDSLLCRQNRCGYRDTLKLIERNYLSVYFTPRDSLDREALYLGQNRGLIGFRGPNNRIYERID